MLWETTHYEAVNRGAANKVFATVPEQCYYFVPLRQLP